MTQAYRLLRIVLSASFAMSPWMVFAADLGAVRGVVHDAEHRPVAAASVELKAAHADLTKSAVTNPEGDFAFPSVPLGDYVLRITADGFEAQVLPLTVLAGTTPYTHVQLTPGSVLQTVTVTAPVLSLENTFTPT
ncbi:MAG: carboxypeptidase-like regulatory domain-containing protein, partial [Acetobacteraceae bacterium]